MKADIFSSVQNLPVNSKSSWSFYVAYLVTQASP